MPEKQRSTGFAIVFAFSSIGWMFGPLVGGYLYDNKGILGIRVSFLFSAIGILLVSLVYYLFLTETLLSKKSHQKNKKPQSFSLSRTLQRFMIEMGSAYNQMSKSSKRFLVGFVFYRASGSLLSAYWSLLILYAMGFSGVEFGFIELAAGLSCLAS